MKSENEFMKMKNLITQEKLQTTTTKIIQRTQTTN